MFSDVEKMAIMQHNLCLAVFLNNRPPDFNLAVMYLNQLGLADQNMAINSRIVPEN